MSLLCHADGSVRRSDVAIRRAPARRSRTASGHAGAYRVLPGGVAQSSQVNVRVRLRACARRSLTWPGCSSASLNALAVDALSTMLGRSARTSSALAAAACNTNADTFRCAAAAARSSRNLSLRSTLIWSRCAFAVAVMHSQWQYNPRLSSHPDQYVLDTFLNWFVLITASEGSGRRCS